MFSFSIMLGLLYSCGGGRTVIIFEGHSFIMVIIHSELFWNTCYLRFTDVSGKFLSKYCDTSIDIFCRVSRLIPIEKCL
jgi:hypothetical protein